MPFLLLMVSSLLACKRGWDDLNMPSSGVKLIRPNTDDTLRVGDQLVIKGAILDEKGLTNVHFGVLTAYQPWEGTNTQAAARIERDSIRSGKYVDFGDSSILTDVEWPQGRTLVYSYVTNVDGIRSDTNKTYRYFRNTAYPLLQVSSPALGSVFTPFFSGQNIIVTGTVRHNATDTVEVTARVCLLNSDNTLKCDFANGTPLDSVTVIPKRVGSFEFRDTVIMPLNAQVGQLYRIKVTARSLASGKSIYQAPGLQFRTQ